MGGTSLRGFKEFIMVLIIMGLLFARGYTMSTYLVSEVNKDHVFEGDVVKVYGYVYDNYQRNGLKVKVYLNGRLHNVLTTNKDGYFEDYIQMKEVGVNIINVIYKNQENTYRVLVYKKQVLPQIEDNTYYSKIIIVGDKTKVIYPYEYKNEIIRNQYVNVELSTKELSIPEYGGGKLKVYVYNHLNHTEVFSVNIEGIEEKDYYTSGSLELKPLERGSIVVFINPLKNYTKKEISIVVKGGNKTLVKKKAVLEIVNKKDDFKRRFKEDSKKEGINISLKGVLSLILIFAGTFMTLYGLQMYSVIKGEI